jgi:hypothetical protein
LRTHGVVKKNLEGYVGTFENLDKVDVCIENSFLIEQCGDVEGSNKPNFSSIYKQSSAPKHLLMIGESITNLYNIVVK